MQYGQILSVIFSNPSYTFRNTFLQLVFKKKKYVLTKYSWTTRPEIKQKKA